MITVRRFLPRRLLGELQRLRELESTARAVYVRLLLRRLLRLRAPRSRADAGQPICVLFVCHGNIMRSAVAEALLRARLRDRAVDATRVVSAGTHAVAGRLADPRMQRAALRAGVSLESHRATAISAALLSEADLILVMDHANEADLLARFPGVAGKVRLLGSYAPSTAQGAEIRDPYMDDDTAAETCCAHIGECVDALLQKLWPGISVGDAPVKGQ